MKELEDAEDSFALAALVEAIENQIADGQPRETGLVMMALLSQGADRQEALEQMALVLAEHVALSLDQKTAFDINRYAQALMQLAAD